MISRRTVFAMYQFKDQEFLILSISQNCRLIGKQLPNTIEDMQRIKKTSRYAIILTLILSTLARRCKDAT